MAGNSRPSFTKRQKERARQEKQAEKKQRLAQRKQENQQSKPPSTGNTVITYGEDGYPQGLGFHDF